MLFLAHSAHHNSHWSTTPAEGFRSHQGSHLHPCLLHRLLRPLMTSAVTATARDMVAVVMGTDTATGTTGRALPMRRTVADGPRTWTHNACVSFLFTCLLSLLNLRISTRSLSEKNAKSLTLAVALSDIAKDTWISVFVF